jgi:hypothetical protein
MSQTMSKRRNRAKPSKRPAADFDPDSLIRSLYEDLVEVEALAVHRRRGVHAAAAEAAGTSGRAPGALQRGEELVALHEAAQVAKRSPVRRAR